MNPPGLELAKFVHDHRREINSLVRSRSYPGFVQNLAVETGLEWMDGIFHSSGTLDLYPLELSLDLAVHGLLREDTNFLAPVMQWIPLFPEALKAGGQGLLIDWVHLLLRLRLHPEVMEKLGRWLPQIPGKSLDPPGVRQLLAAGVWLSGLAPWRSCGVGALAGLPKDVSLALQNLAVGGQTSDFWSRLMVNPLGDAPCARVIGGVQGFSGEWRQPPQLTARGDRLFVRDSGRTWEIVSDYFGSQFTPLSDDPQIIGTPVEQPVSEGWNYHEGQLQSPRGRIYPFPFGPPPPLLGLELPSGLAALVSSQFFSVLLLYRGCP